MWLRVLLFSVTISPQVVIGSELCERLALNVSSVGLQDEERCGAKTAEKLIEHVSKVPHEDCDIIHACSGLDASEECALGVRRLAASVSERIELGEASWAHLNAALVQYTDGEVASELLGSLSYLLPRHRGLLSEVLHRHPHLEREIRVVVDPDLDIRELANRCAHFREILSLAEGAGERTKDKKISYWAKKSYQLYQCSD